MGTEEASKYGPAQKATPGGDRQCRGRFRVEREGASETRHPRSDQVRGSGPGGRQSNGTDIPMHSPQTMARRSIDMLGFFNLQFERRNGTTRMEVVHDAIQIANIADLVGPTHPIASRYTVS